MTVQDEIDYLVGLSEVAKDDSDWDKVFATAKELMKRSGGQLLCEDSFTDWVRDFRLEIVEASKRYKGEQNDQQG